MEFALVRFLTGKEFSYEISASVWDYCPSSIVMHLENYDRLRNSVAKTNYNGREDHRANYTIPPFWLVDRPSLLRHVNKHCLTSRLEKEITGEFCCKQFDHTYYYYSTEFLFCLLVYATPIVNIGDKQLEVQSKCSGPITVKKTSMGSILDSVRHDTSFAQSPLCILCYFKMNDVIDNPADCEVRSVIRFLNARHLKPAEIYRQLKEVYGDTVMNERNVRKWCEMFNNGRTNVHDETRPRRPSLITEDLKTKVNDRILQDRRTSLDELHIAFPVISRSLLGEIVSQHLGYHKICARPHTAASTRELLDQFGWEIFDHPPYSPDLAPSDFHLFTKLKDFLGGTRFGSDEELKKTVNIWLNELAAEEYNTGILKLVNRYDKCLKVVGDYVEEQRKLQLCNRLCFFK
ncbi:hypothetical protein ANN_00793 [Periplaneta americana]|uniref:Mos1 transposase HTH domain-containing protein n=1 Tax=Periplaneta americana TaxID=6978 RepID=A0ABQ8TRS7_PERAM|nr:hypothetical protein ANN_00793 [Periplaneta americana]